MYEKVINEEILNNFKRKLEKRRFNFSLQTFDKEISLALNCLLDIKNIKVYPLNENETVVLRERLGINSDCVPKTFEQIANLLNYSNRETVRQKEEKAIRKLIVRIRCVKEDLLLCKMFIPLEVQKQIFISSSIQSFNDYFSLINSDEKNSYTELENEVSRIMENGLTPISINQLNLSVRAYNCLRAAGIGNISDLVSMGLSDVKKIRNLGEVAYHEVVSKVHLLGFTFKEEMDDFKVSNDTNNKKMVKKML